MYNIYIWVVFLPQSCKKTTLRLHLTIHLCPGKRKVVKKNFSMLLLQLKLETGCKYYDSPKNFSTKEVLNELL